MDLDFNGLFDDEGEAPTNPREIFLTLVKSPDFSFLRDVQSDVLDAWYKDREQRDAVIKLNVGSGKTLVGLLALQSSLNEGYGPAVFVAPDKVLVEQVLSEANNLGIEVTTDERNHAFLTGKKILVINVHKLFNGRSVFGVGPEGQKIEIGAVVVDDAHACLASISDQFRIRLPNNHPVYKFALKKLGAALKRQSAPAYMMIEAGDPQSYLEVPFWVFQDHADELLRSMHENRESDELRFSYPLIAPVLKHCRCVISGNEMEITPPFPTTDIINSFHRAKRRIYMTATLSDDSVLVTHFGARPEALKTAITAASSQAMGERMILMPQELNPDFKLDELKSLLSDTSAKYNVVVIVPSIKASKNWNDVADQILLGDDVSAGVEKLRTTQVGLTVLINRYDGIDLPRDACRVLAIIDLPEASSLKDRVDAPILGDSKIGLRRQLQRIEQGMGRGVRSTDDHCVVILHGSKLTQRLLSKDGRAMLTGTTLAQLDLSQRLAKQLKGASKDDLRQVVEKCLTRDKDWVAASKRSLLKVAKDQDIKLDPIQLSLRRAYEELRDGSHTDAAKTLQQLSNSIDDEAFAAWTKVRLAEATNFYNPSEAQRILQSAYKLHRLVVRPVEGVTYQKLTASQTGQAIAVQRFFRHRFLEASERILFVQSLADDLTFEPDTAEKFEQAIMDVGKAIGINSQRPESELGEGPDNLWALQNGWFLVIECKNGSLSSTGISKTELGQLGQAMSWFQSRYSTEDQATPIIIHPHSTLGPQASALKDLRAIDKDKLDALKKALEKFVKAIAPDGVLNDEEAVRTALQDHRLNAKSFISAFTVAVG